jgi:hypothetical protein
VDDVAAEMIDREQMLADFDHARDDFELAYSQVPEEALDYKPEGDYYAIADLVPHVTGSILRYSKQLDLMKEAQYKELRLVVGARDQEAELVERHRETRSDVNQRAGQRQSALDEMEAAHDAMAAKLRALVYDDYARLAPVYYPGSQEVYPTRPADITGWLADHYREHVPHIVELLEKWKASAD